MVGHILAMFVKFNLNVLYDEPYTNGLAEGYGITFASVIVIPQSYTTVSIIISYLLTGLVLFIHIFLNIWHCQPNIDDLAEGCAISNALALEIQQCHSKP